MFVSDSQPVNPFPGEAVLRPLVQDVFDLRDKRHAQTLLRLASADGSPDFADQVESAVVGALESPGANLGRIASAAFDAFSRPTSGESLRTYGIVDELVVTPSRPPRSYKGWSTSDPQPR